MRKRMTIDSLNADWKKMRDALRNGLVPPAEYNKFCISTLLKIKKLERGGRI